jgi:hypothetical protein
MDNLTYLPVSIGEAIDKLTILDIKLDKIQDARRNDVKKEYDMLYEKLNVFIEKYHSLYKQMKHINLLIWDMMDKLRDGKLDDHSYFIECKRCVEYNDIRFRVKNKINDKAKSSLKEQKGYLVNKVEININDDVDVSLVIKPIKYLSLVKDLVIVNTNNDALKGMLEEDSNVIFMSSQNNENMKTTITSNMDVSNILEILEINENELNILLKI